MYYFIQLVFAEFLIFLTLCRLTKHYILCDNYLFLFWIVINSFIKCTVFFSRVVSFPFKQHKLGYDIMVDVKRFVYKFFVMETFNEA